MDFNKDDFNKKIKENETCGTEKTNFYKYKIKYKIK